MTVILVADNDWAIGAKGQLLTSIPEDMKHFRETTSGSTVVMGRKTYESFPKRPLPNRENCVISHSAEFEGAKMFRTVESFLEYAAAVSGEIYVIGGGEVYAELLPHCDRALITRVYECFGGDVFFADIDRLPDWELAEASPIIETGCHNIRFMLYKRKDGSREESKGD
ncbi:MAG: dihydrofolate reductase, partial [Oscillospiraceae bacterium]|nr:dihydrofolate reductase [Oscillospiraceae bacterium]